LSPRFTARFAHSCRAAYRWWRSPSCAGALDSSGWSPFHGISCALVLR